MKCVRGILNSLSEQDDQLVGGGVPDGGFAGSGLSLNNNPPLNTGFGGTTGVITFYTQIQENYSDTYPSGDPSVDAGDRLTNEAIIDGRVLNVDNLQPYDPNTREDDNTSTQLEIASGNLYKSIYAINGEIYDSNNDSVDGFTAAQDTDPSDGLDGYASGIEVSPGDEITYRITYDLPVSDVENLTLEDFFPLPAYDVADFDVSLNASYINNSNNSGSDLTDVPLSGFVEYGPAHNFPDDINTVSTNSGNNSIKFDFGVFDDTNNNPAVVDLLITLPIQDKPVADGLLFTNQVHQEQQNTFNEIIPNDAIIQINLLQPNIIDIDKGVVAFSSDNTTVNNIKFDPDPDHDNNTNTTQPSAPSTATFDSTPGAANTFTGTVVSKDADTPLDNLETNPIDSNLDGGLEAGDIVTFAITVENLGRSPRGAFDVVVKDILPAGFKIPDGNNQLDLTGINLQVKDGKGNPINFEGVDTPSDPESDFFGNGIILIDDPGVDNDPNTDADNLGAIAGYILDENGNQTNPGENIAIITFDLEVDDSGTYQNSDGERNTAEILINTATLDGYANTEGGERFSSTDAEAEVELESPEAVKSIVTTSEEHTDEVGDGTSNRVGNSIPDANKPRRLAIGEIVRYRLVATIPEGTAKNFQLRDRLPGGLVFLEDKDLISGDHTTAKAAFVSNQAPITSVTTTDTSFGNTLNTGLGSPGSFDEGLWKSGASASGVTPSFSLPNENIGSSSSIGTGASGNPDPDVYYSGTDIYFKFGDLTNLDRDEDKEYVIVEFNALVTNDYQTNSSGSIITNDAGENRANSFQINVGTETNFNTPDELVRSDPIYTRFVEPDINLTKEVGSNGTFSTDAFPADSGDTVQFRLTFSNEDNLYRNTTAFEVALTDRVPAGLTIVGIDSIDWDNGDGTGGSGQTTTGITSGTAIDVGDMEITPNFNVGTNDDISINVDRMPTSGSISVIYSATVDGDVNPENLLTNTANITYTSLPETETTVGSGVIINVGTNVTDPSDPNYTGSRNTGTPGGSLGNRNGDDGVNGTPNDYAATDNAQVEIVPLEPVKRLISTTEVSTTDPNVIIGETLRYQLEVTIPEGVSNDFEITDAIPEGLIYAGNAKVAFISSDTGTNTSTGENLGVYSDNLDIGINPQISEISGVTVTTPTFSVPDDVIFDQGFNRTFDTGEDVTFALGTLTNNDRDPDKEYIVIEFDTIVTDVTALENQRIQVNNFSVTSNDNDPKISNDVNVDIVIDYGDAPDTGIGTGEGNYETTDKTGTINDGAAHGIVDNVRIGSTVDSDDGTLQNEAATADVTDEDGVTFNAVPLNPEVDNSYSVNVSVTNTSNKTAKLVGWIDFDQSGTFDSTEAVTADVATGSTDAEITLTWDRDGGYSDRNGELPLAENIKSGNTYARFRLSTDGNLTANLSTGYAYDGEVEDYQINIGIDYGDAPDTGAGTGDGNYETTDKTDTANDGAAHGIVDNLSIGSTVDRDDGTLENNTATADNLDGDTPNDEDGVTFSVNPLDPDDDTSYSVDVSVTNNTTEDATVVGWVDFNQDGVFDSTEAVTANVATGLTDANITLTWDRDGSNNGDGNGDLPAVNEIKTGSTYARFRLSNDPNLNAGVSTGFLADGEVEDYQLDIGVDYGDAPDTQSGSVAASDENTLPDYQTTAAHGGASHVVEADNLITIGTSVDTDSGNAQNDTATADGADEEGVFVGSTNNSLSNVNITAFEGNTYSIDVIVNDPVSSQDITLVSWIDFNRNGQFESTEAIELDTNNGLIADGVTPNQLNFTLPAGVGEGPTVARFRVASGLIGDNLSATTPNSAAPNGEVEDYVVNLVEPASVGNTVFLDNNGNGIFDLGESGVSGVIVTLTGGGTDGLISTTSDNTTVTTTTDASGNYSFTGLNPEEQYQVAFDESTLPTDHQFTKAGAGTDETVDSDADASGITPMFTLTPGENNNNIDAGIYQPASLGDTLFLDKDNDGVKDGNDSGVSGITVTLTGGGTDGLISTTGDNTTATIVTDASGNYSFTGLTPGEEYQVSFDTNALPGDAAFTTQNASTDGTIDSDVDASGVTPVITLTSGEENLDIDAGIVRPGSIGDTVFIDINNDGIKDGSEPGVSGVTVTLIGGGDDGLIGTTTDNTTITTSTNASGNYSFTGLNLEEEYQVSLALGTLPTDGKFTTANVGSDETIDSDANTSGVTSVVTLSPGENNLDIDAGIIQPASLGDTVFLDTDGDGIQNSGESGVSGVTVTLTGGGTDGLISTTSDNSTVTVTTDASGNYSFTGLTPAEEYQVSFDSGTLPPEHQFTESGVGTDRTVDSDADASGVTPIVTLTSGAENNDIDAGILKLATIGDTVFLDNNGNSIFDAGESGVSGVTVTLTGGGDDGLISTTGDNSTVTVVTDASGNYSFTGLNPGEEYQVTFDETTLPADHQFIEAGVGTDETVDSDADASGVTPIVTLTSGEENNNIDAGILELATIGDTVFLDNNGNSIFDAGESGVSGVTVTLVGGGDDGLISTTGDNSTVTVVTDASGNYSFTGLNPGEEYQVTFDETTLPADHQFIEAGVGTDETVDSDADASGVTPIVTLTSGENNPNIDAGILELATIGDTVFLDNDGDGIQDSSETGVSGVTVTLTGGGDDGLISTTTDNTTVSITTDSSGNYSFTGLNPGSEYQVTFDETTLPADHQFIEAGVGTDVGETHLKGLDKSLVMCI